MKSLANRGCISRPALARHAANKKPVILRPSHIVRKVARAREFVVIGASK